MKKEPIKFNFRFKRAISFFEGWRRSFVDWNTGDIQGYGSQVDSGKTS